MVVMCVILWSIASVSGQDSAGTFVLVHGAFQDETGWAGVTETLEAQGATVITVQNAGRGDDDTRSAPSRWRPIVMRSSPSSRRRTRRSSWSGTALAG